MSHIVEGTVPKSQSENVASSSFSLTEKSGPKISNPWNAACMVPNLETDLSWQLAEESEFWKALFGLFEDRIAGVEVAITRFLLMA
jgi:hypothetical protein